MFTFLESIKGLKRFSYVKPHEDAFHEFDPSWMRAALVAHAKHSFEYLRITSNETEQCNLLGDFRGFTALRELETNIHHLVLDSSVGQYELIGLLPASIEKVYLHGQFGWTTITEPLLTQPFYMAKLHLRLPNLIELKLSSKHEIGTTSAGRRFLEPWVVRCRDVGIELIWDVIWQR